MMDFIDDIYIYGGSNAFLSKYFSIARSFSKFQGDSFLVVYRLDGGQKIWHVKKFVRMNIVG